MAYHIADDRRRAQIGIERRYYTTEGKEWSGGNLKEGEALIVRVGITANVSMPDDPAMRSQRRARRRS
mgnify:CR=1 FL=1